jgi:RNA polymerase sigma-70 factor (ECF subfamily)
MALRADDVNLGRDRALVELFQSGDGRAFEDLYRRYFQRIYRYCLKRVGDPHEAEELAQEAFVKAYSAMPRLGGDRRFYPWLSVIASRLCVDTHRRRGRTQPHAEIELGVVDGGQEEILLEVDRDHLGQALDRIAPRHREVLRLREHEGWSYEQIARHLEVRVGTVEALLFRARRALRREFHAVAGTESRLLGLPIIGYLGRRVAHLRGRIEDVLGHAAAPLAVGSVAAVAAVMSVTFGQGSIDTHRVPARGVDPVEMITGAVTNGSLTSSATAANASAPAVPPVKDTARQVGAVVFGENAGTSEFESDAPVSYNVAGLTISADPKNVADDADDNIEQIQRLLP